MDNKELAVKISAEVEQFPAVLQTLVKSVIDTLKNEIGEGRVLLGDLLESEEKLFSTIAQIIDISTNTGVVDPFDYPFIERFVKSTLRPLLVKCLGDDFMDDLRKMLG
jgi:hypothetical protein